MVGEHAGEDVLEPVAGQLQYMGGRDDTQGYTLRNRYGSTPRTGSGTCSRRR